jgi:hypothetical protein
MSISRPTAHVLLNRLQVIMSAIEQNKAKYAVEKIRELAFFISARTETAEEEQERAQRERV